MEASGKQDLWTRQPLQSAARYGPGSRAAPGTFGAGIWGNSSPSFCFSKSLPPSPSLYYPVLPQSFRWLTAFLTPPLTQASGLLPSVSLLMEGPPLVPTSGSQEQEPNWLPSLVRADHPAFPSGQLCPGLGWMMGHVVQPGPGQAWHCVPKGLYRYVGVYLSPAGNPGWQSSRPLRSLESHSLLDAL